MFRRHPYKRRAPALGVVPSFGKGHGVARAEPSDAESPVRGTWVASEMTRKGSSGARRRGTVQRGGGGRVGGKLEEAIGAGGEGQASEQAPELGDGAAGWLEQFGEGEGGVHGFGASGVLNELSEQAKEVV